jgi:hypothetical protein
LAISVRTSRFTGLQTGVDLVLGLEFNHPPGCDVLVAAVQSVFEALTLHRGDLVANLHEAKGIGN